MVKFFLIVLLVLFASVIADPALVYNTGPFYTPFGSAALMAPAVAPVAPLTSVASVVSLPYTSMYGAYSYADYSPLISSAYSLPYTVPALDWYYRK